MLELFFALLLQFVTLQNGGQKPADANNAEAGKPTTTNTTNKVTGTGTLQPGIGSGGWDDKN